MILLLEAPAAHLHDHMSTFDMLESLGFDVTQVTDANASIDYFHMGNQWPEVILMDFGVAEKEVYQAAVSIKTLKNAQHIPIIFLIDAPTMDIISQCLIVGDDYLSKPFSLEELLAKIHVHQKMRQLNRQLEWQNKKLQHSRQTIQTEHAMVENIFSNHFEKHLLRSPTIRYHISPMSVFHGDVLLTAQGPSGNIYIALGDVTGHGLPAAVGAIPAYQSFRTTAQKGMPVGTIAEEMNKAVFQLLPDNMLMALTLLEFNPEANMVTIWSGGMPPLIWTDSNSNIKQRINSIHGPLAMFANHEFSTDVTIIRVDKGDKLYLMTDGVEECRNPNNEMFGESRLLRLFNDHPDDMFNHIIDQLEHFSGDSARDDDITMVEFECAPCETCECVQTLPKAITEAPTLPWQLDVELNAEHLRTMNVVPLVSKMLSNAIGIDIHRDYISTILSELFGNALEHGLLKLDSAMKQDEESFFEYYQLRKKRLTQLESGYIKLNIKFIDNGGDACIHIDIKDSGEGFTPQDEAPNKPPERFGHGINIVRTLCSSVEYLDGGSRVRAIYCLDRG